MKTLPPTVIICCGLFIAINSAFAQTWIQATNAPNEDWYGVASSVNGNKLVAVSQRGSIIYTSTNSGATWSPSSAPAGKQWQGVASSADGVKLAAADANGSGIFTSTNSGQTWISNNVPSQYWWSVASSADGTKLAAVTGIGGGPIYTSTNSGQTWNKSNSPTNYWSSVASSADGTKLAAAQLGADTNGDFNFEGSIYTSTNSGTTWTQAKVSTQAWESIACSADGTKLIAAGVGDSLGNFSGIYTLTNSGGTWVSNSVSQYVQNWSSVAISADGSKMAAVIYASNGILPPSTSSIYTSTNSGATWQTNNSPNSSLFSIASSADGSKLVVVAYGGGIWTLQTTPSPQLNINPSTTNLALSWLIPSTNFAVQQSSNLISWVDLTNTPALNLTNLQNQVTLSPTNGSGFFRLISQ
jgi:hypothetical protein